jgi:hypothetical protein
MKSLIDTILNPVLSWLTGIYNSLTELQVPLSHPLDISKYLGAFALLGPGWISFIVNACLMAFIYVVCFIIVAQHGLYLKFKDTIKWW